MGGPKLHGTSDVDDVHGAKSLRTGMTHANALRRGVEPCTGNLSPNENAVSEGALEQMQSLNRILLGYRVLKNTAADGIFCFQQHEAAHMQNRLAGSPPLPRFGAIRIAQEG